MARKFLYGIVVLVLLAIAGAFAFRFYGNAIIRWSMVPRTSFVAERAMTPADYALPAMWLARPDLPGDPARWTPPGYAKSKNQRAAVFFVHPTSYLVRDHWNAPLDDAEANGRAALFLRGQASALDAAGQVWAPRYRQAAFGAFLTTQADAERALNLAYRDVTAAFEAFLTRIGPDRPIILAGHSQGALHVERLLRERIAGTPLARRIAAAYVVGWPISRVADLPALGLPECTRSGQSGCILSWQSFAEPADPSLIVDRYDATTGLDGQARKGTPMVCTNPLTGTANAAAPASANLGTLFPDTRLASARIIAAKVPARCDSRGFLLIGEPPPLPGYVLPGNNYHVYDYSLFWANVRADALTRTAAWRP